MYICITHPSDSASLVFLTKVDSATEQRLSRFLAGVERRAFVMAEVATRDPDEALDLVQDAMLSFVRHYAQKPETEWPPLFYRVVQNRIRDWHRRGSVKRRVFGWFSRNAEGADAEVDLAQQAPDPRGRSPEHLTAHAVAGDAAVAAVAQLPLRQQQAFMLRTWEGMDVATTAAVMGCSEGSVKTHLSRALATLRKRLEDHY